MKFLTDKALKSHELHTHVCTYNEKGQMTLPFLSAPNGRVCRNEADIKVKLTKSEKLIQFHCPGCRYMTYDHVYWEVHIQVKHGQQLRYRSYQRWYGWKTPFRL